MSIVNKLLDEVFSCPYCMSNVGVRAKFADAEPVTTITITCTNGHVHGFRVLDSAIAPLPSALFFLKVLGCQLYLKLYGDCAELEQGVKQFAELKTEYSLTVDDFTLVYNTLTNDARTTYSKHN